MLVANSTNYPGSPRPPIEYGALSGHELTVNRIKNTLTFSHLSTHLVWNSCRHGSTLSICRISKSHMQMTQVVCFVSHFSPVYLKIHLIY